MRITSRFGLCTRFLILALLASAGAASAAVRMDGAKAGEPLLQLKAGDIQTSALPNLARRGQRFDGDRHYVLQLDSTITAERTAALVGAGVTLGQYLPENAYVVNLNGVDGAALERLGFVRWVGEFQPRWKLDPELGVRPVTGADRLARRAQGVWDVCVVVFAGADATPAIDRIRALGGQVSEITNDGAETFLDAKIPAGAVNALAQVDEVQYIEEATEITLRNDSNRWILQSNVSAQTPVWDRGLQGQNQIGGLIDGPPRESHCMFDDTVAIGPTHRKIIAMRGGAGSDTHGTHTAGTMAGDNSPYNVYTTNDGMAFQAKLSCTNLGVITTGNLQSYLDQAYGDGARVHSNSWGDDSTTAYTSHCNQIDAHSYAKEDSLVCFAVTNLTALKTPENAKNVLATAATQDTPNQGTFCSGGAGPTADGRRKPEIMAPGCNTTSANAGTTCGVTNLTGTSMSCPAIAGSALLVRQYFTEGFYPSGAANASDAFTPSGALMRAAIMNGGVDMTGMAGYPGVIEGWGRLLLDNVLYFSGDARDLWVEDVRNANGLTTGQSDTYTFNVNSSGQALRITLTWTEPAAATNSSNPTINNLNLEVTDPVGTLYRGNVFTSGQSSSGGTADAKNNTEMVIRTAPTVGTWTVRIVGATVNQGTQGYAVVATGDLSTCTAASVVTGPTSQTVNAGDPVTFSVTAGGTGPFTYQWKLDGNDINGATSDSYTIAAAGLADEGAYSVQVSNGCGSVASGNAILTVVCLADFDGTGFVDFDDYIKFVQMFELGDDSADVDGSGFVDFDDFIFYVGLFEAGC